MTTPVTPPPFEMCPTHPDWPASFCYECQVALIAELEQELARLHAILLARLDPTDCEVCFGEGEVLHLKADGTLYETGACKVCIGTGNKREPVLDDATLAKIEAKLRDPATLAELHAAREEEYRKALKCSRCYGRCDTPFGDGALCLMCLTLPLGEDMRTMVY